MFREFFAIALARGDMTRGEADEFAQLRKKANRGTLTGVEARRLNELLNIITALSWGEAYDVLPEREGRSIRDVWEGSRGNGGVDSTIWVAPEVYEEYRDLDRRASLDGDSLTNAEWDRLIEIESGGVKSTEGR